MVISVRKSNFFGVKIVDGNKIIVKKLFNNNLKLIKVSFEFSGVIFSPMVLVVEKEQYYRKYSYIHNSIVIQSASTFS